MQVAYCRTTDSRTTYCDNEGHIRLLTSIKWCGICRACKFDSQAWYLTTPNGHWYNSRSYGAGKPSRQSYAIPLLMILNLWTFKRSETTAVFRLESRGMKDLTKRLAPDHWSDIIALVALFNRGPLHPYVDTLLTVNTERRRSTMMQNINMQSLNLFLSRLTALFCIKNKDANCAGVGWLLVGLTYCVEQWVKRKPKWQNQRLRLKRGWENGVDGEPFMKIFDLVEKSCCWRFL